ncbi:class C sortase [Eubacteriales bacterium KG127]
MRNRIIRMFIFALIILGIGLIVYPEITFWYYNKNAESIVETQEKNIKKLDKDEVLNEFNKAKSYNSFLSDGNNLNISGDKNAFETYESCLNLDGNGVMGVIDIPKIHVHLPIFHGTSRTVLEMGAGHMENTELPIGEKNSHSIITAHTGHPRKKLFTDLIKLKKKDYFYLTVLGKKFAYQVVDMKIIVPDNINMENTTNNEAAVTLLTCYPYGVNTHRLIVKGRKVPFYYIRNNESKFKLHMQQYFVPGVFGLIITIVYIWRKRKC